MTERAGSYEIDAAQVRVAGNELWENGNEVAGQVGRWRGVSAGDVGGERAAGIINRFIGGHTANASTSGENFRILAEGAGSAAGQYVETDDVSAREVRVIGRGGSGPDDGV
ncbi:MAG: hypothetical protein ACRCYR_04225 [Phycicoccus sp.]